LFAPPNRISTDVEIPSLHEHTNPSTQRSKLDLCGAATLAIHAFTLMTT
jgi:hypothetical protein